MDHVARDRPVVGQREDQPIQIPLEPLRFSARIVPMICHAFAISGETCSTPLFIRPPSGLMMPLVNHRVRESQQVALTETDFFCELPDPPHPGWKHGHHFHLPVLANLPPAPADSDYQFIEVGDDGLVTLTQRNF
jgi:hypothetical protein